MPTLVLTNLRRHRVRSLFGVVGIAFGVTAMLTVLSVVLGAIGMFRNILDSDSQYLVFERNVSDLFFSSVPEHAWETIRGMPEVAQANPVLFGIVSVPGHPVITCFGIEADNPRLVRAEWLSGRLEDFGGQADGVYLGSRAIKFVEVSADQRIDIGKGSFRVAGVLQTENGFEDGGIFMPLTLAQEYFHREGLASIISVNLKDADAGDDFVRAVEAAFPELTVLANEAFGDNYSQFKILTATAWAVGFCAFLLGGMSVANTMTMSVFTRIREIAILRVCGFSRRQLAALILGEAACLSLLGLVLGLGAGFILLGAMEQVPQFQGYIQARISMPVVAGVVLTAFVTSLAGSIYPAWHASRIQPSEALRYE